MPLLPLVLVLDLTLSTLGGGATPAGDPMRRTESAVLAELNRARVDPAGFAQSLRTYRGWYRDRVIERPGADATYLTQEGVAPVDEAIAYVERRPAHPALGAAPVLTAAAAQHQAEQRLDGAVGHAGRDGSTPAERVRRAGGGRYVGEVIAYGSTDPADIVRQLVVDDGVSDRGHRRLLFDDSLRYAGVSCGAHPVYRFMCVITLGRTPDGRPLRG